jgi:hypothetical protein
MYDTIIMIPTRTLCETLSVGDYALNPFGRMARVTEISYRGMDAGGKAYVGYYTANGPTSAVSGSYKEGELVRTVATSTKMTSVGCDALERAVRTLPGRVYLVVSGDGREVEVGEVEVGAGLAGAGALVAALDRRWAQLDRSRDFAAAVEALPANDPLRYYEGCDIYVEFGRHLLAVDPDDLWVLVS